MGLSLLDPRTLGQQERCVKWARACEQDLPSGPGDQMMQFVRASSLWDCHFGVHPGEP